MKLVNLIDNADLESPQLFFRTLKSSNLTLFYMRHRQWRGAKFQVDSSDKNSAGLSVLF